MAVTLVRIVALLVLAVLSGCAALQPAPTPCPAGTQQLPDCPPVGAVADPFIDTLYEERRWRPPAEVEVDPIEIGKEATILQQSARTRLLGPTQEGALNSLAAKLWMIESAGHTVDAAYYIFTKDRIGLAILGALCDAVRRGVDVRLMVDAIGSFGLVNNELRALQSCARQAGFMHTADGRVTIRKARAQVVVFNALTNFGNYNRRSHDKLLVVDGRFPDRAVVMTGGRNISLAYYGITADGQPDLDTYLDTELMLRTGPAVVGGEFTVGESSEIYFTLLLHFPKNRLVEAVDSPETEAIYRDHRDRAAVNLAAVKAMPLVASHLEGMPQFMRDGWHDAIVLLAHEFGNLTDSNVLADPLGNLRNNPNSITYLLKESKETASKRLRLVSPYLFAAQYRDADGNILHDDAVEIAKWLDVHPEHEIEIIVNSVLTSDNVGAQAVIDMDLAPRLLLDEESRQIWLAAGWRDEVGAELADNASWRRMVEHPRLRIYQTGRNDDARFGGEHIYGKLHAKFIIDGDLGFIGTSNFDYRSRLFNNEMGFFVDSSAQSAELDSAFEYLKELSYLWGSPEWLEMRRKMMESGGIKAWTVRRQRTIYKFLKATGLKWFF